MTADGVLVARRMRELKCNRLEHSIARLMPVGIVNTFELIQIHEQHGKHPPMPSRPGDPMIQPIMEEHAVREPCQLVIQGGLSRAFFLLERRGQLMIDESTFSNCTLQQMVERHESFNGFVQVPGGARMVLENLADSRQRFDVYERVLHPVTRCDYRTGGLLDEVPHMLALPQDLGEDGSLAAIRGRPYEGAFFRVFQIRGAALGARCAEF
jgi:hypothetical protein